MKYMSMSASLSLATTEIGNRMAENAVKCPWCGNVFKAGYICPCRAENALQTPLQRKVSVLQIELKKLPQVPCPLTHEWTADFYVRTIFVPAGSLVISKMFKAKFPFVLVRGKISVAIEGKDGKLEVVHREGPDCFITDVGVRRIIMHHTDCKVATFHPNPNGHRDVESMENEVIYDPEKDLPKDIPQGILKELCG